MRTAEDNRALMQEFMDRGLNARDLDYIASVLTDDFREDNPVDPAMGNTKDAALASFRWLFAAMPDATYEIDDVVLGVDRAAVRSTARGTDSGSGIGAMMGAGPTGKPFSAEGIDVVGITEDGRFDWHYGLFDVPSVLMQIGLMPMPGDVSQG